MVTVKSTSKETKKENADYVNYSYDTVYEQKQPEGTSGISKEGSKGYTVYNYERTVTTYSDGTKKYGEWVVASKSVVAPVNGVKWIGAYVEPIGKGWDYAAMDKIGAELKEYRASKGLSTTIKYDTDSAKYMAEELGFGHVGNNNEVVAIGNSGSGGYNIMTMWKNSPQHNATILVEDRDTFYVGAYDDGTHTYYIVYTD